jgi:ketosteroid isomerase-like protein
MSRILGVCVLFLSSALIAFAQGGTESPDKSMILALESAWNQAELHHDAAAVAAIMADNFISVDHHGKLLSRSQYLADLKDPSFHPEEISNSDTQVYIYGDTAIVTSAYHTRGTDSGKPFSHHGRFTDTWIRRGGKWQCIADQETLIN